ncbi:MAG: ribosome silencing factor [Phycisphaerales bacterium]
MAKKKTTKKAVKKSKKKTVKKTVKKAAKKATKKTAKKTTKKKTAKKIAVKSKTPKKEISDPSKAFALEAAKIAAERNCTDIVVLDLSGKSPATDYFVIATGTSDRQMRSVANEICDIARKQKMQRFGRAGYEQARWILLDYVDVVIHLFDGEYRDYYDLELLWGDAKRLTIDD